MYVRQITVLLLIAVSAMASAEQAGINIQAFFDNESRTYLHRDPLNITVMADSDCYFRIIHIDANNQTTIIYPNSEDTDNRLLAKKQRKIFETLKCYLYAPYGEEKIMVAASLNQFKDIEIDYSAGDYETKIYNITIVKPNEEYEYGKPPNMAETVQTMRNDALQQGGTFDGNETSGLSVVNNVRVSYRVPGNTDTIQFAFYNLDNSSGGQSLKGQARGVGFNFSFEKPGNITQTIQMVRSGIEGKGGVFNGNEQQGSFKASGIEGQYIVAELVNVTITDKPVLIPNSIIERKVKDYFEGR